MLSRLNLGGLTSNKRLSTQRDFEGSRRPVMSTSDMLDALLAKKIPNERRWGGRRSAEVVDSIVGFDLYDFG